MSAAQNAAEDNLPDYTRDLLYSVNDSFLEELDEDNISTIYRKVVTNSVAYMMMERLGIDTEEYFEREDFEDIINFNTPGTLNALGFATSDIAEMGLTEIAKTVMSLERQNRIIAENRKPDYNIGRNQNTEAPVQSKPIGRIDYLHTDGRVRESIEYTSPYQFEKDIKEENYYGVPMKIVLYKDRDGTTIPQDFISQLDPSPQGVEIIDSPYLKSSLDIAKEIIDEYCREEFERDEGADYSNLSEVNVAYTTTEDDKHEIQANVNLVDFKIETLVDGTVIRTEQYDSLEDMTERGLKNLSFDDLVYLSEVELERVEKASAPVVPAWETVFDIACLDFRIPVITTVPTPDVRHNQDGL